ncbi:MAG: hypothetical protein AB4290_07500 [Spirulina sp.]
MNITTETQTAYRDIVLQVKVPANTPDPQFHFFQRVKYLFGSKCLEGKIVGIEYTGSQNSQQAWTYSVEYEANSEKEVQMENELDLLEYQQQANQYAIQPGKPNSIATSANWRH